MRIFRYKTLFKIYALIAIPALYFIVFSGFKGAPFKESVNNPLNKPKVVYTSPPPGGFTNFIWNNEPGTDPDNWILNNAEKYMGDLHFTGVHAYDNLDGSNPGTSAYGQFNTDLTPEQLTNINALVDEVMVNEGLGFMYERVKIAKLCYAQRMEYEAEGNGDIDKNYGFSYQTVRCSIITDQSRTVIHADPSVNNTPRYICEDIYENLQHGDMMHTNLQAADAGTWYLKPMMRIPTGLSGNTNIVRIDIINYRNDTVKSVTIKAENFGSSYNGDYIDVFTDVNLEIIGGDGTVHDPPQLNDGQPAASWWDWKDNCKTDFKVWWFGNCEVWFDKMTVDDEWANKLFDPNPNVNYDDKIENEIQAADSNGWGFTYFSDEMLQSQIRCIKYVQDKMAHYSGVYGLNPPAKLNFAMNNFLNVYSMKHDSYNYRPFLEVLQPASFNVDAHELLYAWIPEDAFDPGDLDPRIPDEWKKSNDDYNEFLQYRVFGDKEAVSDESIMGWEVWQNSTLPAPWGTLVYEVHNARTQRDIYSPDSKFIMQPQLQYWGKVINSGTEFGWCTREPTSQEIEAQAMISISHGAEGLCWYLYQSTNYGTPFPRFPPSQVINDNTAGYDLVLGMLEEATTTGEERHENIFGQNKWNDVAAMNLKIEQWKPTLDAIDWQSGWSVHSENANHEYIYDIMSIDPEEAGYNPCMEDQFPSGPFCDCTDERYWEIGFFTYNSNDRYFLVVNRRCVPSNNDDDRGDVRILRIKFDNQDLASNVNWKITEVGNAFAAPVVFSRLYNGYVDLNNSSDSLGLFQPGEGKLFRLVPVTRGGGTLVADEDISNQNFTCEDTVYNGGYNITIDSGTTICFRDSATIIMNGGTFTSGIHGQNQLTTYKGVGSADWKGLRFNDCNVKIYNSKFQDIASPCVNYAIKMVDCQLGDIRTNQFVLDTDTAGAVQSVYISDPFGSPVYSGLYVNYNSISMANSRNNAICVQGFSGITLPFYAMNNTMTSNGYASGIMLSTVTGGVIKNNSVSGFSTGVNLMFSTVDMYGNQLSNTSAISKGIMSSSSTTIDLLPVTGLWLGGFNSITNTNSTSKNIQLDNSVFSLDDGNNTFDVSSSGYHLYGTFPMFYNPGNQRYNCYKVSGSADSVIEYVTDGSSQLYPVYVNYACGGSSPGEVSIVDIGNGLYDTIPNSGGGGGGSVSSIKKAKLFVLTSTQLYDSIRVNMRKRNYTNVKSFSNELLSNYPNTSEAISTLEPLYISTVASDTSTSGRTALKNFYEELILENGSNTALVKISNYLVQKCKVLLGEYSSALAGFQQIINSHPYTYEGLLARWDYMATSLLAPGGGGMYGVEQTFLPVDDEDIWEPEDDKSPFSREQRKVIRTSVNNAFETGKTDTEVKIKRLEDRTEKGDKSAENELTIMRTLRDVNKSQRPKNIAEHIAIVSNDVQRIFGNTSPVTENNHSLIPETFSLSQNFPNPFNPLTTIRYALPKDVMVVVKVYDILGREVRTMVNELQKAGYYEVKFDGTSLASGVYFYRIEAGDFVVSKKMVLIK